MIIPCARTAAYRTVIVLTVYAEYVVKERTYVYQKSFRYVTVQRRCNYAHI